MPQRKAQGTQLSPVRTCLGCRRRDSSANLLRMVVSGGDVLPDPCHRAPGRGAHLHPTPECLDLAERRKVFPRAFRHPGPLTSSAVREYVGQRAANGGTSAVTRPPATTTEGATT